MFQQLAQKKPNLHHEVVQEPDLAVVDALADARLYHLNNRANERTRGVVFAAVTPGIAHVADLGFVEMRELVLSGSASCNLVARPCR
jgi:hypothetical protein